MPLASGPSNTSTVDCPASTAARTDAALASAEVLRCPNAELSSTPLSTKKTAVVERDGDSGVFQFWSTLDRTKVRIIADETTNSLVIRATPRDYRKIQAALERLELDMELDRIGGPDTEGMSFTELTDVTTDGILRANSFGSLTGR